MLGRHGVRAHANVYMDSMSSILHRNPTSECQQKSKNEWNEKRILISILICFKLISHFCSLVLLLTAIAVQKKKRNKKNNKAAPEKK